MPLRTDAVYPIRWYDFPGTIRPTDRNIQLGFSNFRIEAAIDLKNFRGHAEFDFVCFPYTYQERIQICYPTL